MKRLVWTAVAAACLVTPSLFADEIADRLQQLENRIATLERENAALKKQVPAKPEAVAPAVMPQGKEAKLAIGGFVQFNGEAGDAPDSRFPAADRFLMRRARLGVRGSFVENVEFVLQGDFGNNSLNSTSGYRAQMTDGYVVWNKYSFANVTAGQFKMPFGYEQLLGDTKTITVERSLPNDQLTIPRQVGAMVSGAFLEKRLNYAVAIANGNGTNVSYNDNEQFDYVGRVSGVVVQKKAVKASIGANAFTGYDTGGFTGHRTGRGVDAQVVAGPLEINGEWLRLHYDRDFGVDYNAQGWSLLAAYTIVPNRWRAVFRFENFDPNTSVSGDATNERIIGIDYFLKGDDLKFTLNYVIGSPPNMSKHRDRLLGRFQVVF